MVKINGSFLYVAVASCMHVQKMITGATAPLHHLLLMFRTLTILAAFTVVSGSYQRSCGVGWLKKIHPLSRTQAVGMAAISEVSSVRRPSLPIPPMWTSTTPGTWAYDTMSRRVDAEILQRTYDENRDVWDRPEFESILKQFNQLRTELQHASSTPIRYLKNEGEEEKLWNSILHPYVEKQDTWLSAPWLVTEFYLYRRLLECTGYFHASSPGYLLDPFQIQKRSALNSSIGTLERVLQKLESLLSVQDWKDGFPLAVEISLWGNQMDLSLWPVSTTASNEKSQQDQRQQQQEAFGAVLEKAKDYLLQDDTHLLQSLCDKLLNDGGGNIDIIVDNAGFELVTDLALADFLVTHGIANCVTFQVKSHPTFVSDAMEADLLETVKFLSQLDELKHPHCHRAGVRWKNFLLNKQWKCSSPNFWVLGQAMWEMEDSLYKYFMDHCDLAIVKG